MRATYLPGPSPASSRDSPAFRIPLALSAPAVAALGGQLLGNVGHAVVGTQRDHVLAGTDDGVEPIEQAADRAIEVRVHVPNFLAARPERVADQIGTRKADARTSVRVLAKLHRLDECGRHPSEVRVGERAVLPLVVVVRIGLVPSP